MIKELASTIGRFFKRMYEVAKIEPFFFIVPYCFIGFAFVLQAEHFLAVIVPLAAYSFICGFIINLQTEYNDRANDLVNDGMALCERQSDLISKQKIMIQALLASSEGLSQRLLEIENRLDANQFGLASVELKKVMQEHNEFYKRFQ